MKTITIITYITGIDEQLPEGWEAIGDGSWLVLVDYQGHNKRFIPVHNVIEVQVRKVAA